MFKLGEDSMKRAAFTKILLLCFFVTTLSIIGFSQKDIIASNWTSTPMYIDGISEDWSGESFHSEKRLSVDYCFRNDGENLYVLFLFKDPQYLSTIKDTGMTLWFNLEGKKKRTYGITFTKKAVSSEVYIAILEQQQGPLSEQEKNSIRANPQYFLHNAKVAGTKSKETSEASDALEAQNVIFRTERQKEGVVYEFAIPLKRATEESLGIGAEPGKVVKIAFEWGGITPAMKEARLRREAEPEGRPMDPAVTSESWSKGSSYGRGMPGELRGPKKYTIWVDVELAQSK